MLEQAPSWREVLAPEFEKPYMQELLAFLKRRNTEGAVIYPDSDNWFHALEKTPLDQVKVVILGQDPYHQPGQAQGLSFSVKPGVKIPPSLRNIYKELSTDVGFKLPNHGSLESWADQGVLLLNAVLTVEDSSANAHQGRGWEQFTDKIIELVNVRCAHCVFILWGSYAQKKGTMVDQSKHQVISSAHPSPLSAHRGFFGSQPFSRVNEWLISQGQTAIDWQLPIENSESSALIQTTLDLTHTEAEG
jgi:uracil-DNA glycosylase